MAFIDINSEDSQDKYRVPPNRDSEELIAFAGVECVRIAPEHVLHRLRVGQHHELAIPCHPDGERITVAARTRFEERQG